MLAQGDGLGRPDARLMKPIQVAKLLLSPHLDHLARVAAAVAVAEAMVTCHIAVPVLENEDRRLVDLRDSAQPLELTNGPYKCSC